jgi:hypothetical protein
MASIISAGTTSGTAIAVSGDTTGNLAFTTQAGANTITVPNVTGTMMVNGPAFSAYKNNGNQSISASTFTKITFDTELFDTNNNYASSTFTPTVSGYYQINGGISTANTVAQTRVILMLYKNGSAIYTYQDLSISSFRYSGSVLVQMNGTTDYLEIYAYIVGTSPLAETGLGSVGYNSWFNGCLVRSA